MELAKEIEDMPQLKQFISSTRLTKQTITAKDNSKI